jgi:hypothetical protein
MRATRVKSPPNRVSSSGKSYRVIVPVPVVSIPQEHRAAKQAFPPSSDRFESRTVAQNRLLPPKDCVARFGPTELPCVPEGSANGSQAMRSSQNFVCPAPSAHIFRRRQDRLCEVRRWCQSTAIDCRIGQQRRTNQAIALQSGSPEIDAIPVAYCSDQASPPNPITTDQRGLLRPDAGEQLCDSAPTSSRILRGRRAGQLL